MFVGSESETWNMDPELLEEAIKDRIAKTGKTPKAIVPVALYGMLYQIDKIMEIAKVHQDRYLFHTSEHSSSACFTERRK